MNGENPNQDSASEQPNPDDTITPEPFRLPISDTAAENPFTVPTSPEILIPQSTAIPPNGSEGSIIWTASEFVAHQKTMSWYLVLGVGAVFLAVIIWLLTKDIISTIVVVVVAIVFGVYGARQPRQLDYALDKRGLSIGPRYFAFDHFRSFSIVPEGAFASIVFVPLKRFAPLITIYYDPADEAKIVDLLLNQLPHEERRRDMIERLMWRVRF